MSEFDILFLCHERDKENLKNSIKYAKENVIGYRKIFVLSKEDYFPNDKDITFISENRFSFNKETMGKYSPDGRAGWYYQQFLKLYFLKVTGEEVLDNVLCIDADSMFIKPTTFFENDIPLYNVDTGSHQPYFDILEKIFGFGKQNPKYSGTTHHMMYQRKYIEEILNFEYRCDETELWKAIMKNIDKTTVSGFSEQDLYFNYMLRYYPNKVKIRKMRYMNFPYHSYGWIKLFRKMGYNYLSVHDFIDDKFSAPRQIIKEFIIYIGIKDFMKNKLMKLGVMKRK